MTVVIQDSQRAKHSYLYRPVSSKIQKLTHSLRHTLNHSCNLLSTELDLPLGKLHSPETRRLQGQLTALPTKEKDTATLFVKVNSEYSNMNRFGFLKSYVQVSQHVIHPYHPCIKRNNMSSWGDHNVILCIRQKPFIMNLTLILLEQYDVCLNL